MKNNIENVNILKLEHLRSPIELKTILPSNTTLSSQVLEARHTIENILNNKDPRLLGIVGPCSIHDYDMAIDYAKRFKTLRKKVSDTLYLVMRVYFEKPRTTLGWRGLFIDPDMNNTNDIQKGLQLGRKILLDINSLGVPAGSEYLDPIIPNYIDDLICWASIGARTIESQTHRDMASGVSVPVGFKNSTDGNFSNAINAMLLSNTPRGFIGTDKNGNVCIVHTTGNQYSHLILRGGKSAPNYSSENIKKASKMLSEKNLPPRIVVDCSHDNSLKNHEKQKDVLYSIVQQYIDGQKSIKGFMLESNIKEGSQIATNNKEDLIYGKSVTDPCISFEETEEILFNVHKKLSEK